ncbi:MAG: type I-B CRISPR-associated protein Cas8b1/Cst1 [Candidatus Omnitrophica bacterium]|nr:type I-B CRISPR-associated protein Cas8b1/Cst1 [Candidatus Omnitrophota bacterium]
MLNIRKEFKDLKPKAVKGVFVPGEEVEVEVYEFTDLGVKLSVNSEYRGLAYKNEVFKDLHKGQKFKAYIKELRSDGLIDISFNPPGGKGVFDLAADILKRLKCSGGKLPFNDASSPKVIRENFNVSKKVFKRAIAYLYKGRKIEFTGSGICESGKKTKGGKL